MIGSPQKPEPVRLESVKMFTNEVIMQKTYRNYDDFKVTPLLRREEMHK